jgi:PPM family protein phosphatase
VGTVLVHFTAAAASDKGRKRPSNEDAFGYSIKNGIYVLCDGMGGAAAGEVASNAAVREMLHRIENRPPNATFPSAAVEALHGANQAVFTRAQHERKLRGMGTTMVAVIAADARTWVLNVGDSRCYLFRKRHLRQVTIDHSLVDEQVRVGRMSPAEALHSPLRNVITRALGTQKKVTPDVFEVETEPGDIFLLCSDGLTREIDDPVIESILSLGLPLAEACDRLIRAANLAGGHDNVTCLLVRAE